MNDILIVMVKELKEFWRARGGMRSRLVSFLPIFFVFGVFWPLQGREAWTSVPFLPGMLFMLLPLTCLLYTSPRPRDRTRSRMPSSA